MRNKILENRGVTIIHALVGVLIFSVISSIIYSSAITNFNSVESETEFQQSYYSVSSAAQIFVDSIQDDYIQFEVARSSDGSAVYVNESWTYHDEGTLNPLYLKDEKNKVFSSDMLAIFNGDVESVHRTCVISSSQSNIKDVAVEYKMASDYTIYANFSLANNTTTDNYYLCVKIPVEKVPNYNGADHDSPVDQQAGFTYQGRYYETKDIYRITFDASNVLFEKGSYNVK